LNVSKLPPEVLGDIFHWNVTLNNDFGGLEEGSHNFLLVCRHWFEVASSTPEVWSFWGNTPKDWARWCHRSGTAPLDLVLNVKGGGDFFGAALFRVLQDHANGNTIRRIHLKATNPDLLRSLISSLTTTSKELQLSSVESFIFRNGGNELVDVSDFFTHHCYPRLQRLELFTCKISSWDLITSRVTALTTLDLALFSLQPIPTISQLLSILTSNPTLQKVSLSVGAAPDDGSRNPPPRVSLCHLKEFKLDGYPQDIFWLLDRLEFPRHMDNLDITLYGCTVEDVSQIIGPYLRDYLQHCGRSPGGLGLSRSSQRNVELEVGDAGGIDFSVPAPARVTVFMKISIEFNQTLFDGRMVEMTLDLIAHVPREEIVYFRVCGKPPAMEEVSARLPNLRGLHFERTPISATFPKANIDGDGEIFRCLQYIYLDRAVVGGDGWRPLITFLLWRARSGRLLHSLVIAGSYRTLPNISQGAVREFRLIR